MSLDVVPGERVGSLSALSAGEGTYTRNGFIYSKICGQKSITSSTASSAEDTGDGQDTVCVLRGAAAALMVPQLNSIVTCKVLSITPRFAKVSILGIEGHS